VKFSTIRVRYPRSLRPGDERVGRGWNGTTMRRPDPPCQPLPLDQFLNTL